MPRRLRLPLLVALCAAVLLAAFHVYPIDGYERTGIRRLLYLERVQEGQIEGDLPPKGARKPMSAIQLHLTGADSLDTVPAPDPARQRRLDRLFADRDDSYGVAVFDVTPGAPMRYAELRPHNRYQPGSVGKLAIATGFFRSCAVCTRSAPRSGADFSNPTGSRPGSGSCPTTTPSRSSTPKRTSTRAASPVRRTCFRSTNGSTSCCRRAPTRRPAWSGRRPP